MQVGAIGNRVAEVNPDAEADGSIRRLVTIADRNLLLHFHGTADRSVYAVEHDEQRVATGLDDPAAMLLDRRVDYVSTKSPQPLQSSGVIQPDQPAVADHVGIDHRDELPPV
jgi:hypothetical protein